MYRDDLAAAHARIAELEAEVRRLRGCPHEHWDITSDWARCTSCGRWAEPMRFTRRVGSPSNLRVLVLKP